MAKRLRKRVSKKGKKAQGVGAEENAEGVADIVPTDGSGDARATPSSQGALAPDAGVTKPEPLAGAAPGEQDADEPNKVSSRGKRKRSKRKDSIKKDDESEAPAPSETPIDDDDTTATSASEPKKRRRTRRRHRAPQLGPDPDKFEDLNENAKRAIAYTQTYMRDKASWKFSKQRQNWLLRHMLWSHAIYAVATQLAGLPTEALAQVAGEEARAVLPPVLPMPEEGAWVPDEHVSVVAVYLQSMMGLAKERMLETLQAAADAKQPVLPAVPEAPSADQKGVDTAESTETTSESAENTSTRAANTPLEAQAGDARVLIAQWHTLRVERAGALLGWIRACEE